MQLTSERYHSCFVELRVSDDDDPFLQIHIVEDQETASPIAIQFHKAVIGERGKCEAQSGARVDNKQWHQANSEVRRDCKCTASSASVASEENVGNGEDAT